MGGSLLTVEVEITDMMASRIADSFQVLPAWHALGASVSFGSVHAPRRGLPCVCLLRGGRIARGSRVSHATSPPEREALGGSPRCHASAAFAAAARGRFNRGRSGELFC